ncbi:MULTISPECIES: hypothetical protein [Clostridia]|uniref:hypothetical protein n=1 Tax=Clostridia TaxID=186801 RepID=UPI000EA1D324|nr:MULTISPECIES: hypothetical protein [Clostridia]NBJ70224.1 hypothetical protein [Roseburia sp. 1XD42-34]RKI76964.1 hypothetical protein D7V87_12150 [Clostridium sp. 1xD42-85]
MNKKRKIITCFSLSIIGMMVTYYSGTYFLIHTKEISSAEIVDKYSKENEFYISVKTEKNQVVDIQVETKSTWDLIELTETYHMTYSWHGNSPPRLIKITKN